VTIEHSQLIVIWVLSCHFTTLRFCYGLCWCPQKAKLIAFLIFMFLCHKFTFCCASLQATTGCTCTESQLIVVVVVPKLFFQLALSPMWCSIWPMLILCNCQLMAFFQFPVVINYAATLPAPLHPYNSRLIVKPAGFFFPSCCHLKFNVSSAYGTAL